MKSVVIKVAQIALCATALAVVGNSAQAQDVTISGTNLNVAPNPLYGSAVSSNNVVNSASDPSTGSALFDPTGPLLNAATTPWRQGGGVSTSLTSYNVSWFYAGSESGDTITLTAPSSSGPAVTFTEHDQNNNVGGAAIPGGFQFLGTTTGSGAGLINFTLNWPDNTPTGSAINSGTQAKPGAGVANLIFSYATPITNQNGSTTWDLTTTPTDWFVFALNDNGGGDDNHDDFVGFALVSSGPPNGPGIPTPIPAALPLFGSVLGGGFLFRNLRNRRKGAARAT